MSDNAAPQRYCTSCGRPEHGSLACATISDTLTTPQQRADTALLEACREALGTNSKRMLAWRQNLDLWFDDPKLKELIRHMRNQCEANYRVQDRLNERLGVPPDSASPVSDPSLNAER